jgi:hypothetical protein
MLRISGGNLRRRKLRSGLTVAGVVIAIGAFVSMLSFGAGNQQLVAEQFDDLGLLTTMLVFPPSEDDTSAAVLDEAALASLAELPGVSRAYPYEDFDVTVALGDSTIATRAQTLPPVARGTRLFTRFAAGGAVAPGDSTGALVQEEFLDDLGVTDPDSIVGRTIRVSVRSVSADSGFARVLSDPEGFRRRLREARDDSTAAVGRLRGFLRREAGEAARRFVDGYLHAQRETTDTLTVRGVLRPGSRRAQLRSVILPLRTARRFAQAGPGGDPAKLLPALLSGDVFGAGADRGTRSFTQVTLLLESTASHAAIADSVEARGFGAFSYASEFTEIRRMLVFFNLALAAVGFVALVTAALGIVNTMLMSISERRREIGVLKSLGAEDGDVRRLFLVESALIGMIGSALGIGLGWGVARAASRVAREVMMRQDLTPMELFATPGWLVGTALLFGTAVAVVAGALPAARASRVDPVRALRSD